MNQQHQNAPSANLTARRTAWLAGPVAALAAMAALGQGTFQAVTGGLESGTDLVSLPSSPSGTLSATECRSGCPVYRLRFDSNTRFYIGKDVVPYAKFREAARGDLRLHVSYRLSDNTLTRLRIPAAVNP
jgi:hypothetical protein